jgi:hypothetical protein
MKLARVDWLCAGCLQIVVGVEQWVIEIARTNLIEAMELFYESADPSEFMKKCS